MLDCRCAIALRISSTLACRAVAELERIAPDIASRLLDEANQHAARLRAACERGDHGPGPKR